MADMNFLQENRQQKKLIMTQQMKKSINILQLPIVDLIDEINTEISENPLLEVLDFDDEEDIRDTEKETKADDDLFEMLMSRDWDDYMGSGSDVDFLNSYVEDGNEQDKYVKYKDSLYEFLTKQLIYSNGTKRVKLAAKLIIGNLNSRGFFENDFKFIAKELEPIFTDKPITSAEYEAALSLVQSFEPAGIGSRDIKECILIQVKNLNVEPKYVDCMKEMIYKYDAELALYKYRVILSKLGITREELNFCLSTLKKIDTSPAQSFNMPNCYITPDVYIYDNGDDFNIVLNDNNIPNIRVNKYYKKLLKTSDVNTRKFIEDKYRNAEWLISSLDKRNKAIYRVVESILGFQGDFIRKGIRYMKPLKLVDIASQTGLHESTVSRATSGKYAMTTRGLVELKSLFSKGIEGQYGEETSTNMIKDIMQDLINNEDGKNPLSDQRISNILQERDYNIARRTVAKYRDELKIGTKSQRKGRFLETFNDR